MTLHELTKECCRFRSCLDAGRTLLFMAERVFLLMEAGFGRCLEQIHKAQRGQRGGQRAGNNFLCLEFSWLGIKQEFYFTVV